MTSSVTLNCFSAKFPPGEIIMVCKNLSDYEDVAFLWHNLLPYVYKDLLKWLSQCRPSADLPKCFEQVCVQLRQLGCQHDTARICCWAPCCGAVAAGRPPPSISICCPHGAQQQTAARHCRGRMMGQTDWRILCRIVNVYNLSPVTDLRIFNKVD